MDKNNKQSGVALLLTVLLISLVLFMVLYFLSFVSVERKISKSQLHSSSAYYLAESAVNDMINQLNSNPSYRSNFNTSPNWSATMSKNNVFGNNGASYVATISNISPAHGTIAATSSLIGVDGKKYQRVIKVNVFRAVGTSTIGGNSMMADGTITISGSEVTYNGNVHSNSNIFINNGSNVDLYGSLEAVGNYISSGTASTLDIYGGEIYAANQLLGGAASTSIPAVDFNLSATSSLKALADHVYDAASFDKEYLNQDGIIYVIGSLSLDQKNDTYNHRGALVVEGNLSMIYKRWDLQSATTSQPVGIFASGNLSLNSPNGGQEGVINGVLYAGNKLSLQIKPMGLSHDVVINGAIIAKTIDFFNAGTGNGKIYFNASTTIANQSLPNSSWSPVISTDHWEEQY